MERLGRVALGGMRYTRQTMLSEVGEDGQRRLAQSAALVVGAGGLGAPILLYLASAGVGHIGIVDGDSVSESNLNRQVLYTETDLGKRKAPTARERLRQLNGTLRIDAYDLYLSQSNALAIATGYDLIIDACDNLPTRHLLDTASQQLGIPYLYGAVEGFVGQTALFAPGGKVRYRDLFPPGEDEQGGYPCWYPRSYCWYAGCLDGEPGYSLSTRARELAYLQAMAPRPQLSGRRSDSA